MEMLDRGLLICVGRRGTSSSDFCTMQVVPGTPDAREVCESTPLLSGPPHLAPLTPPWLLGVLMVALSSLICPHQVEPFALLEWATMNARPKDGAASGAGSLEGRTGAD